MCRIRSGDGDGDGDGGKKIREWSVCSCIKLRGIPGTKLLPMLVTALRICHFIPTNYIINL